MRIELCTTRAVLRMLTTICAAVPVRLMSQDMPRQELVFSAVLVLLAALRLAQPLAMLPLPTSVVEVVEAVSRTGDKWPKS
jgi:hypothetical protein